MIKRPLRKVKEPWPSFYYVTGGLLLVAVFSVLGQDLINRARGERTYFFGKRGVRAEAKAAAPEAEDAGTGAPARAKAKTETAAEPPGPGAGSAKTEAATAKGRTERPEGRTVAGAPTASGALRRTRGRVALIIDDMGDDLDALADIVALDEPITVSVLPYSKYAQQTALTAHNRHLEVLLHLPLESLNNHEETAATEGLIQASASPDEIVEAFESSVVRVPFADGVNNHMGSRFTADEGLMRTLLEPVKEHGFFFVDSRTTAQTVGYAEALKMGIPSVERDVFLDADADRRLIKSRLIELFQRARKQGAAVGICHPFPETLATLRANFRLFEKYNLEVVPVSRLVHK